MADLLGEVNQIIHKSGNYYDIYIRLFILLKKHTNDLANAQRRSYREDIKWTISLNRFFDGRNPSDELTKENRDWLIGHIPKDKENKLFIFLEQLFVKIDRAARPNDTEKSLERYAALKALNTEITKDLGIVLYKENSFMERYISEAKRFKLEKDKGEAIEALQEKLFIQRPLNSDIKTDFYRITDDYVINRIKARKDNLKLAIVPFSGDEKLLIIQEDTVGDKQYIRIEGIRDEEIHTEHAVSIINILAKKEVDIIIFPEMIFTDKMLSAVSQAVKENRGKLALVVCGSIWKDKTNRSVLLAGNGIELGTQYKLNRFKPDNKEDKANNEAENKKEPDDKKATKYKKYEDIELSSDRKIIKIYDLEGFGRLCTSICVDFVNGDCFDSIVNSGINVCFVPAYTESLYSFKENASLIGSKNFTSVFVSNYCGKIPKENISFAYLPELGRKSFHELICDCKDSCKEKNCNKILVMDFSLDANKHSIIKLDSE